MFFYDKQFDHTIWRMSDVDDITRDGKPTPPKSLRPEELTMIDAFSGLGTVAIAAKASGFKVHAIHNHALSCLPRYFLSTRAVLFYTDSFPLREKLINTDSCGCG